MATFSARLRPLFPLLALLIFSFFFLLYNLRHPSHLAFFEKKVFFFTAQCQEALNAVFAFPVQLWKRYVCLLGVEEKSRVLAKENERLWQENAALRESALSAGRLREQLDFKKGSPLKLLAAEIVGIDASLYFKSIFIDKGKKDGIKKNMAAISPRGVVGRILKVTNSFSMVILLVDQNFALDTIVQRTRSRGVVEGMGDSYCRMKYVLSSDDIRSGDLVVTSGLEGVFPKGTVVGKIMSVKKTSSPFKDVVIKPVVDFGKLEEVFIVLDQQDRVVW